MLTCVLLLLLLVVMSGSADGSSSERPTVLLACAIGRLSVDSSTGELSSDAHQLLADSLNEQNVTPAKPARQHLRAILRKGAHKLQPGRTPALRTPRRHTATAPCAAD